MYPGHTGHNLSSSRRFLRRSLMLPYQAATTKQISFALLRKSMWREQRKSCDRRGPGRSAVRFYSFFFQNSHKNQFLVWRRLVFNQITSPNTMRNQTEGTNLGVKNNLTCLTISHVKILIIACFPSPAGLTLSPRSRKISLLS